MKTKKSISKKMGLSCKLSTSDAALGEDSRIKLEDDASSLAADEFLLSSPHEPPMSGLAAVFAKTLSRSTNAECVILAKGKTDRQIQASAERKRKLQSKEEDGGLQVIKEESVDVVEANNKAKRIISDSVKRVKVEDQTELSSRKLKDLKTKKNIWASAGRLKPGERKREEEKQLQRIGVKGVVQLFNAVSKQQKMLEEKLKGVSSASADWKREKVIKSMSKGEFLDMLKGGTKATSNMKLEPKEQAPSLLTTVKKEKDEDENPAWSTLRDDFMMGAKMKDWDGEDNQDNDEDNDDVSDNELSDNNENSEDFGD